MRLFHLLWPTIASAQQEPFGEQIGVWKFTQASHATKVICRAFSPGPSGVNIVGRTGDGKFYVSMPSQGIPKGNYEGSNLGIAGQDEPVNSSSDGARYVTPVDEDQLRRIIKAKGYEWRAMVSGQTRSGYVSFDGMIGAAVTRLRECTRANGGR